MTENPSEPTDADRAAWRNLRGGTDPTVPMETDDLDVIGRRMFADRNASPTQEQER